MRFRILIVALVLGTTGCATIIKGTKQPLSVETGDVTAARCTGKDGKGNQYVWPETPAQVVVTKGNGPIEITCQKPGFETATQTVEREGNFWPAGGFLFGITGGLISIVVDETTGAAGNYPESVTIEMKPATSPPRASVGPRKIQSNRT